MTYQIHDRYVDPLAEGCAWDGVTDDAPAFNTMLAGLTNGGEVKLPHAKTMLIKSPLVVPYNNIRIYGPGDSSTILADATFPSSQPMIDANNGSTGVKGLRLEGVRMNGATVAYNGVNVNFASGGETQLNRIVGCTFKNYLNIGIDVGANGQAVGCFVEDTMVVIATSGNTTTATGINMRVSDYKILNCEILNAQMAGIATQGAGGIKDTHIFAPSVDQTAANWPVCVLVNGTGAGLFDIHGYFDNPYQNPLILVQPPSGRIDRIKITGKFISQLQAKNHAGVAQTTATWPMIQFDDTSGVIKSVYVDVIGRGRDTVGSATLWTNAVQMSATTAASATVRGTVTACAAAWNNTPLVGSMITSTDNNMTTPVWTGGTHN